MIDQETLGASLAYTNKALEALKNVVHYLGVTTTTLSDGATTNPITINGTSVTAVNGDMVFYNGTAYTWDGTEWQETLSIAQIITQIETITDEIGNLSNLTTEEKSNLVGAINEIVADIPKNLSDLNDDATHRLVTDTEKSTWNGISLKTATGNPISLTDAANANAEKLLMTIEPVQSGSGDPSPTNVRPISGLTEGTVFDYGENLIDITELTSSRQEQGIAFTLNGDGSVTANGTATGRCQIYWVIPNNIATQLAGKTLSGNLSISNDCVLFLETDGAPYTTYATDNGEGGIISNDIASVPASNGVSLIWRIQQGVTLNNVTITPRISDANTATITLGQTVYGGSVNFKTGEVTVTHGMVDLGTLDYNKLGSNRFMSTSLTNIKAPSGQDVVADILSSQYFAVDFDTAYAENNNVIAININGALNIVDKRYTAAAAFKTAMSGVQLCYELATPTTLTLTPAELELLKGNNTITANGAEISIEYYPDNAIGALAGRVDDKADITYVNNAVATKANITDVNAIKNKDLRFSLNDFTNNGAKTIYESVLAYINSLSASDKPIRNVSFYLTYIENTMPRDLPANTIRWNYSYGEIIFRHNQYVDATIILYPFSTADDASPVIKHTFNGIEGTWHAVLTDKSGTVNYTASDITELNASMTINEFSLRKWGRVTTLGMNFNLSSSIPVFTTLFKLPSGITGFGRNDAIGIFISGANVQAALNITASGYVLAGTSMSAASNYQGQITFICQ